jgi:hypothetical protein
MRFEKSGYEEKMARSKINKQVSKNIGALDWKMKGLLPAHGTLILLQEPRVNALLVMHMHAGQQSHFIALSKRHETNTVNTLALLLKNNGHTGSSSACGRKLREKYGTCTANFRW